MATATTQLYDVCQPQESHVHVHTTHYYTTVTVLDNQFTTKPSKREREKKEIKPKVLPRLELGFPDSESEVLTITP